jgi:alkanesulfonate monooxygenase SsuD/methylene tetrahydromethanopterin reductase-like flavin-dependent oxidoreductase (luciferase family)
MRLYRDNFRPSPAHATPYAILTVHVVCADSDQDAEHLASTVDLNFVLRAKGEYQPLASPEEAAAYDYSPIDRARMAQNRARLFVGSQKTVMARLEPLIAATKADEMMITTMIHSHEARRHSYELLAQAFGLRRR